MSLAWINAELAAWEAAGLRRQLTAGLGPMGPVVELDGQRLVNFASNDYLGLANDPRLVAAARDACTTTGVGRGASPLVCGRSTVHVELEHRLAQFEGTEAALLFPSGFAANAGTIPALVGPEDAVFSDARNHASIVDGCRLSGAAVHIYPHNDAAALDALLMEHSHYRRRLIATDTLFSMDGDLAPLAAIATLAERHDAMLLVDEAHATGVLGSHGRGGVELAAEQAAQQGGWGRTAAKPPALGTGGSLRSTPATPSVAETLERAVHIRVGTLSKALGTAGGFVAGSRELVEWLANRARSYVFSTAQPAAAAAAALAALDIVDNESERRTNLLAATAELRRALADQGWQVGPGESQIIPVIVGDPVVTVALATALRERGFWVPAIRPPTVPVGESLLRINLTAGHTPAMVANLVAAMGDLAPLR